MKARIFFEKLGENAVSFFTDVYEIGRLILATFKSLPLCWFYRRQVIQQIYSFLIRTLPITVIIAVFVGLAAMIQGQYQSTPIIPRAYTINTIFKTSIIELCPIVLALVLAGKLGASLAAEIGSMKISEQIDALETMSLDPIGFLIMPRIAAGMMMLPIITIFANILAIFSVFFMSSVISDWISPKDFLLGLKINFRVFELYLGNFIKPAMYGFSISLVGSYFGLKTHGGALGIGRSSTNAVVVSAILIVIFDYYLGKIFL